MRGLIDALIGALFGVGLLVSGMTRPEKVIGFLDVTGDWDPSLALVMVGALLVHGLVLWAARGRQHDAFGAPLEASAESTIDTRLVGGAALFGIGWGLAGYCPGPALVAAAVSPSGALFAGAMLGGMAIHGSFQALSARRAAAASGSAPMGASG